MNITFWNFTLPLVVTILGLTWWQDRKFLSWQIRSLEDRVRRLEAKG